jgi:hypothetical protein
LKFSTDPRIDHGELLLPNDFPVVADGVTVEIEGLVSGTFAAVGVVARCKHVSAERSLLADGTRSDDL